MKREEIIEALQKTKDQVTRNYKAEIKGIFGSYARGEEKEGSDVDILVVFFQGATLFDLSGLADYLEAKLKLKVDIVPMDAIREEIKENVSKEAVYL